MPGETCDGSVPQAQAAKEAQGKKNAAKDKQAEDPKGKKEIKEEPKPRCAGS